MCEWWWFVVAVGVVCASMFTPFTLLSRIQGFPLNTRERTREIHTFATPRSKWLHLGKIEVCIRHGCLEDLGFRSLGLSFCRLLGRRLPPLETAKHYSLDHFLRPPFNNGEDM